jgi:hypothetical protein
VEILIESVADVDRHVALVRQAATRTQAWLSAHAGDPMDLLRSLKFEKVGFHPVADRALNVIEQVNQTFTYAVALSAARILLERHPDAGGFILAPGAHMSRALDIVSCVKGLVGAETFAAVPPRNNGKLAADLDKLAGRDDRHRYVFFASPAFPGVRRLAHLERGGLEVWSVDP